MLLSEHQQSLSQMIVFSEDSSRVQQMLLLERPVLIVCLTLLCEICNPDQIRIFMEMLTKMSLPVGLHQVCR